MLFRSRDPVSQRRPLDQFHHQARRAVEAFDAVDVRDVLMIQRGQCLAFPFKSAEAFGIRGNELRQNLDRDVAAQPRIVCAVHRAHAAFAELGDDFVRADMGARLKSHGRIIGARQREPGDLRLRALTLSGVYR